jgi:hypothetical protein
MRCILAVVVLLAAVIGACSTSRHSTPAPRAVDLSGLLYLTDQNRVLSLPLPDAGRGAAGATRPTELPFIGLNGPAGIAVDTAGV